MDWEVTINGVTWAVDDTLAYWEWFYDDYTRVGNVDYTQNCHGYAFGAGGWPDDGAYGVDILLDPTSCYSSQYVHNADIAMLMNHGHSIKVAGGAICHDAYTSWEIVNSTDEKNRESPVFVQNGTGCPYGGVNPLKAFSNKPSPPYPIETHFESWTKLP